MMGDHRAAGAAQRRSSTAAIAVILIGMLGFGGLAALVLSGAVDGFDHVVLSWFRVPGDLSQPAFSAWLVDPMSDLTALGGYTVLALLTLATALYYAAKKEFLTAGIVAAAIGSSGLLTHVLKQGFARVRPDLVDHLTHSTHSSFPSGHALQATVAYLLIGALIASAQPSRSLRSLAFGSAILLTVLVGVSRVYLGVHWPSDVLAGWLLGAAWAALWWLILRRITPG